MLRAAHTLIKPLFPLPFSTSLCVLGPQTRQLNITLFFYLTSGTFPSSWSLKNPLKFLKVGILRTGVWGQCSRRQGTENRREWKQVLVWLAAPPQPPHFSVTDKTELFILLFYCKIVLIKILFDNFTCIYNAYWPVSPPGSLSFPYHPSFPLPLPFNSFSQFLSASFKTDFLPEFLVPSPSSHN